MSIVPDDRVLVEGSPARLQCRADANPFEVTYRWFLNQQSAFPENPTEFIIANVSRQHHDMIVKCEARNLIGKSEDSQTLDVTCTYELVYFIFT